MSSPDIPSSLLIAGNICEELLREYNECGKACPWCEIVPSIEPGKPHAPDCELAAFERARNDGD